MELGQPRFLRTRRRDHLVAHESASLQQEQPLKNRRLKLVPPPKAMLAQQSLLKSNSPVKTIRTNRLGEVRTLRSRIKFKARRMKAIQNPSQPTVGSRAPEDLTSSRMAETLGRTMVKVVIEQMAGQIVVVEVYVVVEVTTATPTAKILSRPSQMAMQRSHPMDSHFDITPTPTVPQFNKLLSAINLPNLLREAAVAALDRNRSPMRACMEEDLQVCNRCHNCRLQIPSSIYNPCNL